MNKQINITKVDGCDVDGEITAGKTTWRKLLEVST